MASTLSRQTSETLARRATKGDETAFEELARRMRGRIADIARRYSWASTHFGAGITGEDLFQHGLIGLHGAVQDFDFEEETPFESFAYFCALREVVSAVRGATRRKHEPVNGNASFAVDHPARQANENPLLMAKALVASRLPSTETQAEISELLRLICELSRSRLSEREQRAMALSLSGWSRKEIAAHLASDTKSVENAIRRGRSKLDEALEEIGWERDRASFDAPSVREFRNRQIERKREQIRDTLGQADGPLNKQEIAAEIGCPVQGLHTLLKRMVGQGEICEPDPGQWASFERPAADSWPAHWKVVAA